MRKFRTEAEQQVGKNIERIFTTCPDPVEIKLENFLKYVRRQHLKRFLAIYEIFKLVLPVKGSIIECNDMGQVEHNAGAGKLYAPDIWIRYICGFPECDG